MSCTANCVLMCVVDETNDSYICCYSDSKGVIELLVQPTSKFNRYIVVIANIHDLLRLDWEVNLYHSHREGNASADFLAKLGATSDIKMKIWESPPDAFRSFTREGVEKIVRWQCRDRLRWGPGLLHVGAATKVYQGSDSVILAETMGLQEALNIINSMQLNKVIIEMDAATVVQAIHSKVFPRLQWGILARRCARVIDQGEEIFVRWVSREGNKGAHHLTRWAFFEPNRV
ncbi:ribonuclease H protein [Trifolium medium]|uniref:Ribonuclease H protein n=1 Tax=Trifolium medium TaxID=97028 RepID=A0A392N4Y1_9FABA|nr:ribonuclease H protein [Trifolium medium]